MSNIKYTTVLSTLIGVIAQGNRRGVKYLKQKALVSYPYPYFEIESLDTQSTITDFSVIVSGFTLNEIEALDTQQLITEFSVKELVTNVYEEEQLYVNTLISDFDVKLLLQATYSTEILGTNTVIAEFIVDAKGIFYTEPEEAISTTSVITDFYVGV